MTPSSAPRPLFRRQSIGRGTPKAPAGPISLHHADVIDEGSASGRSFSKTHGEENFAMASNLFEDASSDKVQRGK